MQNNDTHFLVNGSINNKKCKFQTKVESNIVWNRNTQRGELKIQKTAWNLETKIYCK